MSEEVKHSPTPWEANDRGEIFSNGCIIAQVYDNSDTGMEQIGDEPSHHNQKLIEAAPDLLAACVEFVRKVKSGEAKSTRSYQQMRAAIEKATQ